MQTIRWRSLQCCIYRVAQIDQLGYAYREHSAVLTTDSRAICRLRSDVSPQRKSVCTTIDRSMMMQTSDRSIAQRDPPTAQIRL